MLSFLLNDAKVATSAHPGTVLLDFIREEACLPGTKEACREGECGACTVLVGKLYDDGNLRYRAVTSCLMPLGEIAGAHVVTVEGLNQESLTLVQRLILEMNGSQCGFCTPGFVLSLTGFCLTSPDFSYEGAVEALDGNLCRCTGYVAIRNAARSLCNRLAGKSLASAERVGMLVEMGVLPRHFEGIAEKLKVMADAERPHPAASRPPSPGGRGEFVLVAGGTDLFVQKPEELGETEIEFLSRRTDLDFIRAEGHDLRIGAAVTLEDFRLSSETLKRFPSMKADVGLHSSTILRNMATLTGNIVNASPIGDMTIMLLALGARLVIEKKDGGTRERPLEGFYSGYKKFDLAPGELIREIIIPALDGARYSFEKVSNRVTLDIASVNSAMKMKLTADGAIADIRISAGGVAPIPLLIDGLGRFHGRKPDRETAREVAADVRDAATPIDDIRGSAEYKHLLLEKLVLAHFEKAGAR